MKIVDQTRLFITRKWAWVRLFITRKWTWTRLFITRKWAWAKENNLFWLAVALLIFTGVCLRHPGPILGFGPPDFALRAWGMALQLVGVVTVWHDLTTTGKAFGKTNWFKYTAQWLKKGILDRPIVHSISATSGGYLTATCRGSVLHSVRADASLEERIIDIEKRLEKSDEEIAALSIKLDDQKSEIDQRVLDQEKNIENNKKTMESRLEEITSGNYMILSFGVVWLVIGMFLSTWAPELAKFIVGFQGNP